MHSIEIMFVFAPSDFTTYAIHRKYDAVDFEPKFVFTLSVAKSQGGIHCIPNLFY